MRVCSGTRRGPIPAIRLAISLLLLCTAIAAGAIPALAAHGGALPVLQSKEEFGDYTASILRDDSGCGGSYVEIRKEGKLVYSSHDLCRESMRVGGLDPTDPDDRFIAAGTDLTGDGQPDLVVSGYSGGANCCLNFYIFELGRKFRMIGVIDALDDDHESPHFVHLEPGAGRQIVLRDWTFAGWHASFADSPAPLVFLHYRDGRYRLSGELMRESAPSLTMLKSRAERVKLDAMAANEDAERVSWPNGSLPSELWSMMLDLIYTGHADLSWKFLDLAWPPNVAGKDRFLSDFKKQLELSRFWPELRAMQPSLGDGKK
ncbi:MAG TPA: hypothetical protein VEC38_13575 [Candidatus Binataceae bacterium]|nr:hypothetical protein [Candidatus Binataceae bacterium]